MSPFRRCDGESLKQRARANCRRIQARLLVQNPPPLSRLWKWDDGRWKRRGFDLRDRADGWMRLDCAEGRSRGLVQRRRRYGRVEKRLG
jgi:hypothetical protein